jgi:transcription elongation factor Elf1
MSEHCNHCERLTETVTKQHATGTEFLCAVCGHQQDFLHDDVPDDSNEPIGSCENCGTNLYEGDDPDLCDQCLWWAGSNPRT